MPCSVYQTEQGEGTNLSKKYCVLRLLYRRGKEKTMGKKLEYKIIWMEEPDPVKIKTTLCQLYARQNGLEFVGLEKVEKESKGA